MRGRQLQAAARPRPPPAGQLALAVPSLAPRGMLAPALFCALFSLSSGRERRRLQQGVVCGCDDCVAHGNTKAQCQSFGLDCSCHVPCTSLPATEMERVCGAAKRASSGSCFVCLAHHADFAGCEAAFTPFCSSSTSPPPPAPTCADPRPTDAGTWTRAPFGGFVAGSTAVLTCDPGYEAESANLFNLNQRATLTCLCNGGPCNWDAQPDRCLRTGPPPPPPPTTCATPSTPNGVWSAGSWNPADGTPPPRVAVDVGGETVLTCDPGFTVFGMYGESAVLICGPNGRWDRPEDQCLPTSISTTGCQQPSAENGRWTAPADAGFGIPTGTVNTLICDTGYHISGAVGAHSSLTCLPGGQWNGQPDACEPNIVTCPSLTTPHGVWSPDGRGGAPIDGYILGDTTRLVCDTGFSAMGMFGQSTVLTCLPNGRWNRPAEICELTPPGLTTCTPITVENGEWSAPPLGEFITGSTTRLACSPGYEPEHVFGSSSTLTCGTVQPGQWAGTPSTCVTPPPPSPAMTCASFDCESSAKHLDPHPEALSCPPTALFGLGATCTASLCCTQCVGSTPCTLAVEADMNSGACSPHYIDGIYELQVGTSAGKQ